MKKILTILLLALTLSSFANDKGQLIDEIIIPLSSPSEIGKLDSSQVYGGISVTGYDGREVIVNVYQIQKQYKIVKKNGLKMIPNSSFNLEIEEYNNTVQIKSHPHGRNAPIYLEVKVPYKFNLEIHNVNHGNTYVNNVSGEHEISNVNGDVKLDSISGSATVDTVNGKINAIFTKIDNAADMAFSTINKNIDISFPKTTQANIKIKTLKGSIYTGFNMEMQVSKLNKEKDNRGGKHKYGFEQWVKGKINGGGPSYSFSSINGDVIIRTNEK